MLKLVSALLLTLVPFIELRAGMPLALIYALENNIPWFLIFLLVVSLNILLIFIIFLFMDTLHKSFLRLRIYRRIFESYLRKLRKRIDRFEKHHASIGFLALVLFVAVPLPGTGAWSGSILSWVLGLDRKKSLISISLGVFISGVIVALASLGFLSFF